MTFIEITLEFPKMKNMTFYKNEKMKVQNDVT